MRDAWAWAVLPASAARVGASGDSLPATLAAAGLDVVAPDAGEVDVVLIDAREGVPPGSWDHPAQLVAAALGGGADVVPERVSRMRRAASLALDGIRGPAAVAAGRRAAGAAEAAGRTVTLMATGDRARPYELGPGGPKRPRRGSIVAARRPGAYPAALEEAVAAVRAKAPAVGEPVPASIVESGKLIVRLPGSGGEPGAVLRLAGGPARALVDRAAEAAEELVAPDVPTVVRDLMPEQLVAGRAGVMSFAAERWAVGTHPRAVDEALWQRCREFLEGLRAVRGEPRGAGADVIAADVELIAPLVSLPARERLARLTRWVATELEGVPLGWSHGDFWPDNLVVRGVELDCVLDWDTSERAELPVLDALDLLGFASPENRWKTFGPRLTSVLLPLVRSADPRLLEHARSVGAPYDARGLEALAWAWWARRTALTVRDYPDRRARPRWLAENLEAPLIAECPA